VRNKPRRTPGVARDLSDEQLAKSGIVFARIRRKGEMTMNPVVHFEMPAEDRSRMRAFYESTFGWKTEQLGPDMGDYVLVTTTETDPFRRPRMPGMINGGFYPKRNDWPAQYPSVVIAVDDIKTSMKKVADAGGKVLGEPMEIPGYGLYVSFFDSEGNRVSMMQPDESRMSKAK
jgi:predicted enzyme related to lactoylglutathione lyase